MRRTANKAFTLACSLRAQVLCSLKFTKCPTGTFWLKLVAIIHRIAPELLKKLPSTSVFVERDAMAHPMEAEYVMIESFRDAQPDDGDSATVSSPGIESLDQAADAASTALRHAEAEGARGLAVFGQPVLVSELDAQEQICQLERRMQELKVQIANQEDADTGVDLLGLSDPADGGAGNPPAAPGAFGPVAGRVAPAAAVAPTSSSTTPSAAEAAPALLTTMAEPPLAWPVSVASGTTSADGGGQQ